MTASGRPEVAVLAAEPDIATADQVAAGLVELGFAPVVNPHADSSPERAVVILTMAALRSPSWHAAIQQPAYQRLVPVKVGVVDEGEVPKIVKDLNWIDWKAAKPATVVSHVFAALQSNLSRYVDHKRLSAAANAWLAAGRSVHLLLDTPKAVQSAEQHLIDTQHDPLAKPTQLIHDFVAASATSTAFLRRRQFRRWFVRLAAVGVAVTIAVTAFVTIRAVANVNKLQGFGTTTPWMLEERPDRVAMLAAALLLQGEPDQKPLAHRTAIDALAEPWSSGILGANHPSRLIAAAPDHNGRRTLTYDGDGALTLWDNNSLTALWRRDVPGAGETGLLSTSPDLSAAVVASDSNLHMITSNPWKQKTVRVPGSPFRLAIAPAHQMVVFQTEVDVLHTMSFDGGRPTTSEPFDRLLDLRQTSDGGVLALVRIGPDLVTLDPVTNRILTRAPFADHRFSYGTLSPDSPAIFATGPDRQLYAAADGKTFAPTGLAIADSLDVLSALPGGRVAFGSAEFGVQLFDTRTGVRVGEICRSFITVGEVLAAADGDVVACVNYYGVELWRTRALSPLRTAPGTVINESASPTMRDGALTASGDADGRVRVANGKRTWDTQLSEDEITAVSVDASAATIIVGTADGTVVQYALSGRTMTTVSTWQIPDGEPAAAVGRAADDRRLLVRTASGKWWSPWSCTGCDDETVLIDHIRDRLWGCYTENQVEYLDDDSRTRLRIQLCPPTASG